MGRCFVSASSGSASRCSTRTTPGLPSGCACTAIPALSDVQKIAAFRRKPAEEAALDEFFASIDERVADESVDALTRDTLRWYVHEERDSRALLRAAYARVEESEPGR